MPAPVKAIDNHVGVNWGHALMDTTKKGVAANLTLISAAVLFVSKHWQEGDKASLRHVSDFCLFLAVLWSWYGGVRVMNHPENNRLKYWRFMLIAFIMMSLNALTSLLARANK